MESKLPFGVRLCQVRSLYKNRQAPLYAGSSCPDGDLLVTTSGLSRADGCEAISRAFVTAERQGRRTLAAGFWLLSVSAAHLALATQIESAKLAMNAVRTAR